jgi:hypothetical protein
MDIIICQNCKKKFPGYLSNKRKFCSPECYWNYLKGKPSGMLGKHHTKGAKEKIRKKKIGISGKLKEKVGYVAIHAWVKKHKGKPKECEHCGATYKERKIQWANINHKYYRNLDDFISLCQKCHDKYDRKLNNKYKKNKGR